MERKPGSEGRAFLTGLSKIGRQGAPSMAEASLGPWEFGGSSQEAEPPPAPIFFFFFFFVYFQLLGVALDSILLHMPSAVSEKNEKTRRKKNSIRHKKPVLF